MTISDHALARRLADEAGALLLSLRAQLAHEDPAMLRREGDRRSHLHLVSRLAIERPGDAVLSEEGRDDAVRLSADRVWIVDPLDGTREFGELDRVDWAVHVALWEMGRIAAAAVARPAMGSTLATDRPPVLTGKHRAGPVRLAVSRSRPPVFVSRLAEVLDADVMPMGSAGVKAMAVVDGAVDAYVHAGGQYEWDSAAPVGVALAAGLHASRIDGSPLQYNEAEPLLPDLLICRPALAGRILETINDLLPEGAMS